MSAGAGWAVGVLGKQRGARGGRQAGPWPLSGRVLSEAAAAPRLAVVDPLPHPAGPKPPPAHHRHQAHTTRSPNDSTFRIHSPHTLAVHTQHSPTKTLALPPPSTHAAIAQHAHLGVRGQDLFQQRAAAARHAHHKHGAGAAPAVAPRARQQRGVVSLRGVCRRRLGGLRRGGGRGGAQRPSRPALKKWGHIGPLAGTGRVHACTAPA
jgi:hypothetical protein